MNPALENLIVLQAQDLDLARMQAELLEAPARVRRAEASGAAAGSAREAVRSALAAEEKLRRGQESEIASQRTKIARLRRSLDSATSGAQVSAFEHEIGFAEAAVVRLEDEAFASLERTEALEAELRGAEALAARRVEELAAERARADQVVAGNRTQIAAVAVHRGELRGQVDERPLALYDRLRQAKGTAMAEATGNATQGKCSACQMTVRPQRWQDLIGRDHEEEIFTCETCGRMLFWDPRRDTPKPWEAGDRLRRAQVGGPGNDAGRTGR